jgi:hypothetical protein
MLHGFEGAWGLVDTPVAGAGDVKGGNINGAPRKARIRTNSIVVETTLKSSSGVLRGVDR